MNKGYDKTKRPVPNTEEGFFLKSRNCNERIYVYLLLKSKRRPDGSENHRYVEKMSNQKIAEDLGISRNTVGTRIKDLISLGYIIVEGKYYLVPKTDYYALIPEATLDFLLNYVEGKEKLIKLYIVLFDYYNSKRTFTILNLHQELGYQTPNNKPSSKNSAHIRTLLMLLSEAGLVKYVIKAGRNIHGAPVDVYQIQLMRSNIDNKYKESYMRLKTTGEVTEYWEQANSFYD